MPVEYVTSPIIPLSVELDGRRRFIFYAILISAESLQLILKLAKKLCADFSSHYEIYFKNYNNLTDTPVVDEVKMTLLHEEDDAEYPQSSQDIKITVDTYKSDFRSNKHE
jgi:preprotein translocase subunit SecF